MKKELLNKVLLSLFVIMAAFSFTSCEEKETQNGWCIAVDVDQSSANFKANLYVQSAVNTQINKINDNLKLEMMTESEAKKRFEPLCAELEKNVNADAYLITEDTYCIIYLTQAISDPYGTYPVILSKKITFTPTHQ